MAPHISRTRREVQMASAKNFQDLGHPGGWDYLHGSPHLKHNELRLRISQEIVDVVTSISDSTGGRCSVLEVGAGHGTFTDHIAATGADITILEMSRASAHHLKAKYRNNPRIRVMIDPDGSGDVLGDEVFDAVVGLSVVHHIPDYISSYVSWARRVRVGGAIVTFQDPLFYPRQTKNARFFQQASFYAWRVSQGDLLNGLKSFVRKQTNRLDETNSRDMIEYHVVRDGCDEELISRTIARYFGTVRVVRYWSTQSSILQRLGNAVGAKSEFGIVATDRRDAAT